MSADVLRVRALLLGGRASALAKRTGRCACLLFVFCGLLFPAAAMAAVDPIDLEGTYTVYDTNFDGVHPQCNDTQADGTLTISNWYGWTVGDGGYTGVFDASYTDPLGNTTRSTGPGSGNSESNGSMSEFAGPVHNWTITTGTSSVTLHAEGTACPLYAQNTSPESLSSLPSISGTLTKNGKPFDPGTFINLGAMSRNSFCCSSGNATDGSYHYWVQPAQTYSVEAQQVQGLPPLNWYATCIGGRVLPKTTPQGCVFQLLPNNPPNNGIGNFTLTLPLVVNSTGNQDDTATDLANGVCNVNLTGPPACTLRAAIEVANKLGGAMISFDIPATLNGIANTFDGGVPQIRGSGSPLPAVSTGTSLDGTSQPGAGRVELSGTSGTDAIRGPFTTGLDLAGNGVAVTGFVINGFSNGITVEGGRAVIQHDWFGTNATGTAADPDPLGTNSGFARRSAQIGLELTSSGNQVGGPGAGNVFATHWGKSGSGAETRAAAALVDTAGGNVIQGNSFGVLPGTHSELIDPSPAPTFGPQAGLAVTGADTIGGAAAGDGNVIAPDSLVDGRSVVQGNELLGTLFADGSIQIGGAAAAPGTGIGNTFLRSISNFVGDRELEVGGSGSAVVQGNRFSDSGEPAIVAYSGTLIGGAVPDDGNLITRVATDAPSPSLHELPGIDGAIAVVGSQNVIENNRIEHNGGRAAVQVEEGRQNMITGNVMRGNPEGIVLGEEYVRDGAVPSSLTGPNDLQPYPVLRSADHKRSGFEITGVYDEPTALRFVHTIAVDLYGMTSCNGRPQGEVFLGRQPLQVSLGESDFTLSYPNPPAGMDAVTATATSSDGSTSEFSPCFTIGSHPDLWTQLGVAPTSTTVAISTTSTRRGAGEALIARAPAKGHGILLLVCPVTATKYCQGTYTLRTTGKHPQTVTHGRFKIVPGYVHVVTVTITGKLLTKLEHAHHLAAKLTTTAHDGAEHVHRKNRTARMTLVYK